MRVEDDEENGGKRKNKSQQKEVEDDLGLSMLIDSQNNQYVLTKPRDSTMPRADHHFIKVRPFPRPRAPQNATRPSLKPASAGPGVRGDAVPALRLDLHHGRPPPHVRIHHLRGPARTVGPQQHQGAFASRMFVSLLSYLFIYLC